MIKGLNKKQVDESRKLYGDNIIHEAEPETFWDKFKGAFDDPMIKLLLAIAAIMAVMAFMGYAEFGELIGIAISVLLVTGISAKTEIASDNEYRKLKDSTKKDVCKVYRDGKVVEIEITELVVGDMVILQSGDKIPADGYLYQGELRVDNSALNGEAEECKKIEVEDSKTYKEIAMTADVTGDTFVDLHSLFRGAVVFNGEGVMEVTKVGMKTMMGAMAADMADEEVASPLKVKLTKLAEQISMFGYIGSVVIALALLGHKVIVAGGFAEYFSNGGVLIFKDVLEAIMLAVVIVVMAVPEGLPLMIAIVLMRNTSKMLQNNVLVRKPIGIETAGSLNILFSDKTGTITKGQLEVVEFFDGNLKDTYKDGSKVKEMMKLCIGKNTGAMFDANGKVVGGNATDKALLDFLTQKEMSKLADIVVEKSQGFNSANKYSASQLGGKTVYKGAPERLLAKATKMLDENGNVVEINKNKINTKIDELAVRAMRVLSFAYSESELVEDTLPDDLIIVGFVGIRDDVRVEAKQAIEEVQNAGVQVVMITGDRKETAVAIAKEAGLLRSDTDVALTSEELNKMSDEEVKAIIPNLRVIARALPTDKSRMVRIAQELNLVCGMTGDGVNDAPAIKEADIGVAMGISGTDVTKEAASMVLMDDNFATIVSAVEEGRIIYDNIRKFIRYLLSCNLGEVLTMFLASLFYLPNPLTPIQILFVNLATDGLPAIALGIDPADKDIMRQAPREKNEGIFARGLWEKIIVRGCLIGICTLLSFMVGRYYGMDLATCRTIALCTLVMSQLLHVFECRSERHSIFEINVLSNIYLLGAVLVSITMICCILYIPFLKGIFNTVALNLGQWLLVIFFSGIIFLINSVYLLIKSKK